ncbi:helix-turn-helix domain-containing protein [Streptomyces sp. HUAS TT7]|uniref:helix-turn-helix domain-containing protein n=1 Tax=Streptomyces sp. HUAS TT7 TaxID=3447507 RepID=UPI003F6557F7
MLTVDDVAEILVRPKSWVYSNHVREGIPFRKIGQALRCRPADLEKWIDAQEVA